ncbi:MAG: Mannose-6-phosphate isomerase [Labilithrix sp.]|nr:Mannose-6-phosphate isomerase [Labilithrix sp.]
MTMPDAERERAVDATLAACARTDLGDAFARERALAGRLAALYPGDIGIVSALLLELVHLAPGEAIYLGAGNLHAYLEGSGVEIMASSDNVLRGGLTKKHVDVPELLRVLDFGAGPARVLRPRAIDEHESVWDTPAREFRLSRLLVDGAVARSVRGPEILLVTTGAVHTGGLTLATGASAFVPAATQQYTLEGSATVFRATTNLAPG